MVGQRLVEVVPRIPAHRQIVGDLLHELPLGADPGEEHDELQSKEDLGIDGGTTAGGVAIGGEATHKREIEDALEVAVEVAPRHCSLKRDEDGTVEVAGLGWTEHGTPPSDRVEGGMLAPVSGDLQQAEPFQEPSVQLAL